MPKRLPYTPNSKIRQAIRGNIWLRSRERAKALKDSGYCCEKCGIKQSRAKGREVKVEVHHKDGIDWQGLIDMIRERLLSGDLEVLCKKCHDDEHKERD